MAIVHSTSKAGLGRNPAKTAVGQRKKSGARARVAPPQNSDAQSLTGNRPVLIHDPLRAFLGSERDAVIKAQSLVVCVTTAIKVEHGATGPYYPDVLGLVADILRRRVVNLDELLLNGVMPVDQAVGAVGADVIITSILDCHTDVATDEVREASRARARLTRRCRARAGSPNGPADEEQRGYFLGADVGH